MIYDILSLRGCHGEAKRGLFTTSVDLTSTTNCYHFTKKLWLLLVKPNSEVYRDCPFAVIKVN